MYICAIEQKRHTIIFAKILEETTGHIVITGKLSDII